MAKVSATERNLKRQRLVAKYAAKRAVIPRLIVSVTGVRSRDVRAAITVK